jgi:hypothetical protein
MKIKPLFPNWTFLTLAVLATTSSPPNLGAQESTLARQLSQGTAANPYEIAEDGQARRRNREQAPVSKGMAAKPGAGVDALKAWWEGMEEVAEASMETNDWAFHYGLTTAFEYDSNFNFAAVDERDTSIISASPYGVLTYGQQGSGLDFQLRYSPEFRWFSDNSISDVINQSLGSQLGFNGSKSRIIASANYSKNESGNVEVGNLVSSDTYNVGILGSYDVSSKTSIGGGLSQSINEYGVFNSFTTTAANLYADYSITPKTRLGLGVGYQHTEQDNNLSADALNANLRVAWAMSQKVGLSGAFGMEKRSFDGGDTINTMVGDLGLTYALSDKSTLRLSAYRRATPSIGQTNALFYATGVAMTASVPATERLMLSLTTGYENATYESTGGPGFTSREDKYLFIRPTLGFNISEHWNMNLFYQFSDNSSSLENSSFNRSSVGTSFTLAY